MPETQLVALIAITQLIGYIVYTIYEKESVMPLSKSAAATPLKKTAAKPAAKPALKAAAKPVAKPAVKSAAATPATIKPVAKPAAKSAAKRPAKPVAPIKAPTAKPAPKSAAKPSAARKQVQKSTAPEMPKVKKIKQVRDSFTMPEPEYAVIAQVKKACLKAGFEMKKSDLLRIGISLIKGLDVSTLKIILATLTPLKAGRPKK
jgi:hypothetical protein